VAQKTLIKKISLVTVKISNLLGFAIMIVGTAHRKCTSIAWASHVVWPTFGARAFIDFYKNKQCTEAAKRKGAHVPGARGGTR